MPRSTRTGLRRARQRPSVSGLHAPAVVLFLSFIDVFALLPTVAPHVESLGAGPLGIGIAIAAYSAANLPANVVGGILIDRWGRRPILVAGLVLAAVAVAAYPLATTIPLFVLARLAHGIAGGVLVPAVFAVAGDRVRQGDAGRAFGRLGAVIGLAAVVAPASAGIVRQAAGTDAVFLGVAAVLVAGSIVTAAWIRDTPPSPASPGAATATTATTAPAAATAGTAITTTTSTEGRSLGTLLAAAPLRRGLAATVMLTAAVGVLAAFLPGVAEDAGAPPSAVGGLFTAYAVVAGAVMLSPLAGRIDRRAASRVAAAGLAVLALALFWLAGATQLWSLTIGSALFGAGYGLVFPAAAGATSTVARRTTRGRAFGLFNAAFSLGIAAGPPVVGLLIQRGPGLHPFVLAGGLTALVAVALAWQGPRGGAQPDDRPHQASTVP